MVGWWFDYMEVEKITYTDNYDWAGSWYFLGAEHGLDTVKHSLKPSNGLTIKIKKGTAIIIAATVEKDLSVTWI